MNTLFINNEIEYQTLSEEKLKETIALVTKVFAYQEYAIKGSGLSYNSFHLFSKLYCTASLKTLLSIIAVDINSGEVLGFSINEDPNSENAVDISLFEKSDKAYGLFLALLKKLNKFSNSDGIPGNNLHLYLLGVAIEHQKKGIGTNLVKATEMIAKTKRFKNILVEATSPGTKPTCEKLGYDNIGKIIYRDFEYNKKKPFSQITDYDGPCLFSKKI